MFGRSCAVHCTTTGMSVFDCVSWFAERTVITPSGKNWNFLNGETNPPPATRMCIPFLPPVMISASSARATFQRLLT